MYLARVKNKKADALAPKPAQRLKKLETNIDNKDKILRKTLN
jgi:hypothetical protein